VADRFIRLAALLDPARPVAIQTHDYPDIDAVASAWGLASLLEKQGFRSFAVYRGAIRSRSLNCLVSELGVRLYADPPESLGLQIIAVDGSPANGNVGIYPGELVGIIDHHWKNAEPKAKFIDLRPELASCSSMIHGYWREAGETMSMDLATALIAGIQSDTDFLSRRASHEDFLAYTELFGVGDFEKASRIVRTVLDLRELNLIVKALNAAVVRDGMLWAYILGPCGQEVLAVLAEFVLRTDGLVTAVVAEHGEGGVHLSIRSKNPAFSAFSLAHRALEGIGAGGGHSHSAGGFVPDEAFSDEEALRERFFAAARNIST